MVLPANLHTGPAGWTRPDWIGTVYPQPASRGWHPLDLLPRYLNLAEIDSTFEEPLRPEIARLYAKKALRTPDFLFTSLLGRKFTYDRALEPSDVAAWKKGIAPLADAGRLGAVVMQFPWSFRFNEENRQFLIQLRRTFHEFPLAAELRHESWLMEEAITTLVNYRVSFVNLDQPQFFRGMPPAAALTSGVAVVRLHGRSALEAFREFTGTPARNYLYNLDELFEWRPRIERLARNASRVLVITANGAAGRSFVNALQVREILGDTQLQAPPRLIENFPAELAAFRAQRPLQPLLVHTRAA